MKDKSLNNVNDTLNQLDIRKQDCPINAIDIIKSITNGQNGDKDPFYIVDLEDICNKHINWITQLPRVEPHYAVKCNTDTMLLKLLAFLGASFDCASKGEIARVLELGVSPHRIIFANPCKQASYVKYAAKQGVDYMTFDNEAELYKIREHHPRAKCVLRIITNDENAVCRFSMKFGADMETSLKLIETAVDLGIDLVGVSFHVGSGQMSAKAFSEAIGNARKLFDYARDTFGLKFHLLDLGGGYPGSSDSVDFFSEVAREINAALEAHFPADLFAQINGPSDEAKLRIIAEPGRYYACSAFTLCVSVIAKRVMTQAAAQQAADAETYADASPSLDPSKSIMYYINDGVYASFNCLFYDHAEVSPILLQDHSQSGKVYKSSIWGPTCDGLDVVVKECLLPELATEEFMVFKNMGAYTLSGAVAFNGIPLARCIYVATHSLWETISAAFDEPQSSVLDESVAPATPAASCALAFNRTRSMSISLVEPRSSSHDDSDTDASSTASGDEAQVVDLISEVVVEQKEDVDCAIIC